MNWKAIAGTLVVVLVISTMVRTAEASRIIDCFRRIGDNYNNLTDEEHKELRNVSTRLALINLGLDSKYISPMLMPYLVIGYIINMIKWCKILC